jgi:hypothetical protein
MDPAAGELLLLYAAAATQKLHRQAFLSPVGLSLLVWK